MAGSERAILTIARLALVMAMYSCCNGNLQLKMDRSWGKDDCGYLHCWYQDNSDSDISTISDISLYDITQPDVRKQIASIKNDGLGIKINPSSISNVTGNGSISDLNASLSLIFRSSQDCHSSSFLCELGGFNAYDQKETIGAENRAHASDQCDCGTINSQLLTMKSQLSALKEDNSILSTELSVLRQNNSNLSADLSALRIQYSVLMLQFQNLSSQVLPTQEYLTSTCAVPPTTDTVTSPTTINPTPSTANKCFQGMKSNSPRVKLLLWGQIPVVCDTETDGGGWILIQRRTKGDVDFYRNWQSYSTGFGTLDTDFWLGNDFIYNLTLRGFSELRTDMTFNNKKYYAQYNTFRVDNEKQKYRLTVSGYRGDAGDSLTYHDNMMFSTYDQDNDERSSNNCASQFHGAWWYQDCYNSNLNGDWGVNGDTGIIWHSIAIYSSLTSSEIKVRQLQLD